MTPSTRYVADLVAANSRCLCEINDETPCWKCLPQVFAVYWYAKWSAMPVSFPTTFDTSGWSWSVLCPSVALYPRTTGARALHHVPDEVVYKNDESQWSVHGAHHTKYDKSLEAALKAYQEAEPQRRDQVLARSHLWR